ncbi:MAG: serine/threonine protein kinase [Anaerolineales bacterium]|nr:serine/threonine protein kinase [Anaerolineales bacterium]
MVIPAKIGRYEIKSELGRGGMATVYRAYDPSFDREVAIKVLPREMLHDSQFRVRFEREIKMVAGLEHPAIVPVYDVGNEDGQPYFVMRYMTGGSLSGWIEKGKFTIQDTARIIEKIAQGLEYSHRKGIIHRDLKPDNILFDSNGDPFISDFGVAKFTESSGGLTGSGTIGTPAYMSPEQAQGGSEIDGRSDVYGLGVIVYQMLSGQQPYSADTPMGVVVKHITEPVPEILKVLPSLPPEMDTIIKTSMAKDKTKRYPTTIELAKALNLLAFGNEGNITFNTGLRSGVYASPTQQPSRGIMGLVVGGVVLLVAIIGFFLLRNQLFTAHEQPTPTTASTAPLPTLTVVAPTLEVVEPSVVPFAPFCTADLIPALPEVKLTQSFCSSKRPYVSITIPDNATFEPLDPAASCETESTSGARDVISCTGTGFLVFDLKVCTPPVVANEDLNKCSADATFDSANQCCVPSPPEGPGCTLFTVNLKGCQ